MPFCTACDAPVDASDNFCTACGEPVEAPADRSVNASTAGTPDAAAEPATAATTAHDAATATDEGTTEAHTGPTRAETRGRQLAALGAAVSAGAALLPWVTAETARRSATVTGTEADGRITLFLAILAALVLLVGRGKRWSVASRVTVLVFGTAIALIGIYYVAGPGAVTDHATETIDVTVESGLYLTAVGGAVLALGPLYAIRSWIE